MNEAETRAELIDPALAAGGWGVVDGSRARREMIAPGRLTGNGHRETDKTADYVLTHRGRRLAVIEAKPRDAYVGEGVAQAKDYADRLQCRFAFATNGLAIWRIDMATGAERSVDAFPTPEALWAATFPEGPDRWRDAFAVAPYADKGGTKPPRYFQRNAVEAALDAIAAGRNRVLLTLATGTGKTTIALQIAWKLFQTRWSLSNWRNPDGTARHPRILFLADRVGLADQAHGEFIEYGVFEDAAMVRIDPAAIAKHASASRPTTARSATAGSARFRITKRPSPTS
jgi:type I restriction enzyme R subunit